MIQLDPIEVPSPIEVVYPLEALIVVRSYIKTFLLILIWEFSESACIKLEKLIWTFWPILTSPAIILLGAIKLLYVLWYFG